MLRLVFIGWREGLGMEAAALVMAVGEVDGEGDVAIGVEVPAGAVEMVGVGVG